MDRSGSCTKKAREKSAVPIPPNAATATAHHEPSLAPSGATHQGLYAGSETEVMTNI